MTTYVQTRADPRNLPDEHQTGTPLAVAALVQIQRKQEDLSPRCSVSRFSRCEKQSVHCGICHSCDASLSNQNREVLTAERRYLTKKCCYYSDWGHTNEKNIKLLVCSNFVRYYRRQTCVFLQEEKHLFISVALINVVLAWDESVGFKSRQKNDSGPEHYFLIYCYISLYFNTVERCWQLVH